MNNDDEETTKNREKLMENLWKKTCLEWRKNSVGKFRNQQQTPTTNVRIWKMLKKEKELWRKKIRIIEKK